MIRLQVLILAFLGMICTKSLAIASPIVIECKDFALVLEIDELGRPGMSYLGPKMMHGGYEEIKGQNIKYGDYAGVYEHIYTPSGTWNLVEPALTISHSDGNMSTELIYKTHTITKVSDQKTLVTISLEDPVYKTNVQINYQVFPQYNVIEQWAVINNPDESQIRLEKYASANLYLSGNDFYLRHYHGVWAKEMKPETEKLTTGIKTLDSKLGTRANLFQPASFSLGIDGPPRENEGKVLLANLEWTGNFKIDFETETHQNLRLIAGINPHASAYTLLKGESFTTPALVYTYSEKGTGYASRNLHAWARDHKILNGNGNRLTLLNNWEATYFDFDQEKLVQLFEGAKKLGVDMFLLDDGWFANKYPRNNDKTGLGDWQENSKKLPDGIPYLVKEAEKAGVKFGIWVEPEMVSPKSALYENHRDWVIRQENRQEFYFRNQLVLDLTNPEVQDFVFGVLDHLFSQNPSLAFIKWDCNSVIYNAHSTYLEKQGRPQSHLYVDYVNSWYKILERIRAKYPDVPMMLCSGGGGRADYKALTYFTEFWLSDNTDPIERIFIQWEDSYFFPAIASDNHITDWSKASLKFRTDVAMMGKMGYDIVVDHLSKEELQFSQKVLQKYDKLKDVIWRGDQYRLQSPWENPVASIEYVNQDKSVAVVFNYAVSNRYDMTYTLKPIKLQGLDPDKMYLVNEINRFPGSKGLIDGTKTYSGEFLMNIGFNPMVSQGRPSVVLEVRAVK